MQQAQAAIVFVVLHRLGGAVLFRSSCPSPNPSYRFWLLALTFRSSRPAFCGRLTSPVSLSRIRLPTAQVMLQSITVTHSQVLSLVLGRSAGLRLLAGSVFKAFLAVTVRPHSASSSVFHSIRRLAGVVFHPAANPAVKLTRQRRAAYFVR